MDIFATPEKLSHYLANIRNLHHAEEEEAEAEGREVLD